MTPSPPASKNYSPSLLMSQQKMDQVIEWIEAWGSNFELKILHSDFLVPAAIRTFVELAQFCFEQHVKSIGSSFWVSFGWVHSISYTSFIIFKSQSWSCFSVLQLAVISLFSWESKVNPSPTTIGPYIAPVGPFNQRSCTIMFMSHPAVTHTLSSFGRNLAQKTQFECVLCFV